MHRNKNNQEKRILKDTIKISLYHLACFKTNVTGNTRIPLIWRICFLWFFSRLQKFLPSHYSRRRVWLTIVKFSQASLNWSLPKQMQICSMFTVTKFFLSQLS